MNKSSPIHKIANAQSDSSQNFDPWIIWVTFRRCWMWALPVGAVLAGFAAFGILASFVPSYRATHLLQANRDFILNPNVLPGVRNLAKTEKSVFFHPIVLDTVLNDPLLQAAPSLSDPATAEMNLIKNLNISSGGSESRLEVSYQETDREYAAMICNAIVESYLAKRDAFDDRRVTNLVNWLEPEIAQWEQEVEVQRDKVQELSKQAFLGAGATGNPTVKVENDGRYAEVTRLRSEIANLNVEISIEGAKLAMRTNGDVEAETLEAEESLADEDLALIDVTRIEPTEFDIDRLVQQDAEVVDAKERIEIYKNEMLRLELGNNLGLHRDDYNRHKKDLQEWSVYLDSLEEAARVKVTAQLEEITEKRYQKDVEKAIAAAKVAREINSSRKKQERLNQLSNEREAHELLTSRLAILKQQYDEERNRLEDYGGTTAELQFATEELGVATEVLNRLRGRVAAIRTERRQDGAVKSLALAEPPRTPVEKMPYKQLAVACLAALLSPFLFGLLWELRSHRLTDSSMCDKNGLSVIGEIAQLPSGPRSGRGRRVFEESIDTLRSSLFLSIDTRNTRSIAVVSSMSGEGKSSVSSQLALSIAKATGETVLLVDADLRCPDQHDIFGLEFGPGLTGVLSGAATLLDATDKSLGDLIHVLPAGKLSSSPHRLITPKTMRSFVMEALKEYSYVVIDTAPVLAAGESLAVASAVDASLLCVMRDLSRVENVTRTRRRLEAAGATIAGTVFSGVSMRQYAYRYGNYHYQTDHNDAVAVTAHPK